MLSITCDKHAIRIGPHLTVSFMRTLRVPDDEREYPLPPGLGRFTLHSIQQYRETVPPEWRQREGAFISMYEREALWLAFSGATWKPNAVKIGIGNINAVAGEPMSMELSDNPQNYLVCPDQPWLDGINAADGTIRQFLAMPLGTNYTVEAQLSGKEEFGGIQIVAFGPMSGIFPDEPPPVPEWSSQLALEEAAPQSQMGLAAGGTIRQKIYADPYGVDTRDTSNYGSIHVYIVNSEQYKAITGREAPPSPVSAASYTELGLPWFDIYDEEQKDIAAAAQLRQVRSVAEIDSHRAPGHENAEASISIHPQQVKRLHRGRSKSKPTHK